jgi:nitrogen fixation NifU-like protein
LTGREGEHGADLGKLEALFGVREYPVRIKCATLAWHALRSALESRAPASELAPEAPVSTE